MRIAYVVLFCIVFSFTDILIAFIAIVQSVLAVASGEPSQTLKRFGAELGIYLKQIADFVSFESEEKPFPFADWPSKEASVSNLSGDDSLNAGAAQTDEQGKG